MKLLHLLQLLLCVGLAKAYLVAPPGTAAPGATQQCSAWVQASYALTCDVIVRTYGMTLPQFQQWNPATTMLGPGCNLIKGLYFCTEVDFIHYTTTSNTMTTPQPTSNSFSTTTKTSTTSTISTPTPTQSGMVANCNRFYYVNPGDSCANIASAQGIALAQLYAWNPAVGNNCQGLWADVYICVGVAGTPPPSTTTTRTTTTSNGVVTPTPTQSGMVTNCNRFYFVNSGDSCANIASSQGIALANLYAWNPAIGNNCGGLWANVYICVGVSGTTPTPTTTGPGNGVATPTPIQAGMTTRCNTFHRVVSGDGCWAIANAAGISLDNFYAWNPAAGTNCATLWPDYYVCIAIL